MLLNPDTDPHDFEPPASVARMVADARVVIMNGADYDHWMERLIEASDRPDRIVIDVAALLGKRPGDNPHVWYDPTAMPDLAEALTRTLSALDPEGAAQYEQGRNGYLQSLEPLKARIAAIREKFPGAPVTATEPVFGYMAESLGLDMRNGDFQNAIMNQTEPSAHAIAAMEDDLRAQQVKALFYNGQVGDPLTERLLAIAREAGVPVVSVTETLPSGMTYAAWMLGQLDATEKALAGPSS